MHTTIIITIVLLFFLLFLMFCVAAPEETNLINQLKAREGIME